MKTKHDLKWDFKFKELKEFIKNNPYSQISNAKNGDINLKEWIRNQRQSKKKGTLSKERILKLESIKGWVWNSHDRRWNIFFKKLKNIEEKKGFVDSCSIKDEKTYNWAAVQRISKKNNKLSLERIEKLESLKGWIWNTHENKWDSNFNKLKNFSEKYGHCIVPFYEIFDNCCLGIWVSGQRAKKNRGNLSSSRIEKLESLKGWVWKVL